MNIEMAKAYNTIKVNKSSVEQYRAGVTSNMVIFPNQREREK